MKTLFLILALASSANAWTFSSAESSSTLVARLGLEIER